MSPRIIFLDQNKWISLALAEKSPREHPDDYAVLQHLIASTQAGEAIFPLTSTIIYETYKIGDPKRRAGLAMLQASLSGGLVFRGRYHRLESELRTVLCKSYGLEPMPQAEWWFLSNVFFEAFADIDDGRTAMPVSDRLLELIRLHPASALHDFLINVSDAERSSAVKMWTRGSDSLRAHIESRRERNQNESFAMRRRIYNVLMFSSEVELLAKFARKLGVQWASMNDIGSSLTRRLVNEMPIYHTERELALRLEAQSRPINENDFRDIQAYCAAIPYADLVVGENLIVNLATQAGLGVKYDTRLETDLRAISA